MADSTSATVPSGEVREVAIDSRVLANPLGEVQAGETWSFRATGLWCDGFIPCGADGYRYFPFDALAIRPDHPEAPWFCLMARFADDDRSAFALAADSEITFRRSGALVAFANDKSGHFGDNHGAVNLLMARRGVGATPPAPIDDRGWVHVWRRLCDVLGHTVGFAFIAALTLGVSAILVAMPQGRDLARGLGEDGLLQWETVGFTLCLLFLAAEAWTWARLIVVSSFGADRTLWAPWPKQYFLVWTPRLLGAAPVVGALAALLMNPASQTGPIVAVVVVLALFLIAVVGRQNLTRLARAHFAPPVHFVRRIWVLGSVAAAPVALIVVYAAPVGFGSALGAPAVVFLGLALILPIAITLIQTGVNLRFPFVGVALVAALAFSLWVDNHAVGRRQYGPQVATSNDRPGLATAFERWKQAQPYGPRKALVLVAAQGGASRAGFWTASTLAHLDQMTGGEFARHAFLVNSVSGGSVGSLGFAAALKAAPEKPDYENLLAFVARDALSPALSGLAFTDLAQRFVPFAMFPDRAENLERSWEAAWRETHARGGDLIGGPFLALAPRAGERWRPFLMVQGASERTGVRLLTSAIRLDTEEVDAQDFETTLGHDVAASTAIHNGARFPLVSPAGTFVDHGVTDHIVDGGYYDNSGAEAIREIALALRKLPDGKDLVIVKLLIGFDDTPLPGAQGLPHVYSEQFANDLLAPLIGMLGSMNGHESHLIVEAASNDAPGLDYTLPVMLGHGVTANNRDCTSPMDWALSRQAQVDIEGFTGVARPFGFGADYRGGQKLACRADATAAANCATLQRAASLIGVTAKDICGQ